MQPLSIAVLSALTPSNWQKHFFDDRLEEIDYDRSTDLVAISAETYTAKRAYQIAGEFRKRQIPVVIGGFHATHCPEEVLEYADAVAMGEAEGTWPAILRDAQRGRLQPVYRAAPQETLRVKTDRTIFSGKRYLDLDLIECGRGCRFHCNFCSIASNYKTTYRRRPPAEIMAELKESKSKTIFFVDDNLVADLTAVKELLRAITPLKIRWVSQATINMVWDQELLHLLAESGCAGLLIGFESLSEKNLSLMGKKINQVNQYTQAIQKLREVGIKIYGTFLFGYPHDSWELMQETVQYAVAQKFFLGAFNHLVPFPGTPLYAEMQQKGLFPQERWWLSDTFRFGQLPFEPAGDLSAEDIRTGCLQMRRQFYSCTSTLQRAFDFKANCKNMASASSFILLNMLLRREIDQKCGLPLGLREEITSTPC